MSSPQLKIIGHRGFPSDYPENSLTGILAAIEAGVHGIEIDIQARRDGVPIVMHDNTLERVTGIRGKLSEYDYEVLRMFSAHEPSRFEQKFLPEPILTLESLAEKMVAYPAVQLFVEIKPDVFKLHDREIFIARVWQLLEGLSNPIVIISYDEEVLKIARREFFCSIGWVLSRYNNAAKLSAEALNPDYMICNYKKFPKNKEALWQGDWKWFAYDIVDIDVTKKLINRGVQYIETWNADKLIKELVACEKLVN